MHYELTLSLLTGGRCHAERRLGTGERRPTVTRYGIAIARTVSYVNVLIKIRVFPQRCFYLFIRLNKSFFPCELMWNAGFQGSYLTRT